ncbi:hypothetical protein ACN27E_09765 [Mycobacterium sp. WMMD1722]|uniref:hypothetical protein n=1 Tax=Mycobacterium sp. WMMD1722 TaxID=3404117 RepID=UPI003BF51A8D
MPHPTYWVVGDKLGANQCPRPSFPDLSRGAWSVGDVAARDVNGVTRNRMGSFAETAIVLPGVPVAAAAFKITALIIAPSAGGTPRIGVRPVGSSRQGAEVNNTTGYEWRTITSAILPGDTGSAVELVLWTPTNGQLGLVDLRVDYADSPIAGYFDGSTADTAQYDYAWDGAAFASPSSAKAKVANPAPEPDPEPDPEDPEEPEDPDPEEPDPEEPDPEPEPLPEVSAEARAVAAFLGQPADAGLLALAAQAVPIVTLMAKAYTRDQGFTGMVPNDEIAAVITMASARLVANPEQLDSTVGSVGLRGGFQGWTLAEMFVLNRYRKRAQ